MKVALQLYTVRDCCETGAELLSALKEVKQAGYEGVEFAGARDVDAQTMKQALDQLGLVPVAAHQSLEELENHLEELIAYHQVLGTKALVCAYAPTSTKDEREYLERVLIRAQQQAASSGIQILYHNHTHELQEQDGRCPLDEIVRCCPLELDTYWAFHSGRDVPAYMKEHQERIGLLHLKDGDTQGVPCAIGEGCNPIQPILNAAKELQLEWVIVENDDPVPDGLSDMKRSIQHLKQNYTI